MAGVFRCLLESPLFARAARLAAGRVLEPADKAALAVLAFLHDIGKLAPAFQARGWEPEHWPHPACDHISAAFQWMAAAGDRADTALDGALGTMLRWAGSPNELTEWFRIAFSHHGRPVCSTDLRDRGAFCPAPGYDWMAAEKQMGR